MAGQVANLSAKDLQDLAAFYARQKGSLHVIR
jgi:cytochrome c553